MNCRNVFCLVTALSLLFVPIAYPHAQDSSQLSSAATKPPKPQFFAGTVVEADGEHVKVSRNLVGRQPETRVFMLDGKTKIPKGGVKPKSRVTVRYEHFPEHDLALEIQVRPFSHVPKST